MKKRYKIIIALESIALFLILCVIAFGLLISDSGEHPLYRDDNIAIYEVGRPFIFGPSTVRVYCGNYIFETKIANDGAALTDENFKIVNDGTFYELSLFGSEQNDVTYYLKVQDRSDY